VSVDSYGTNAAKGKGGDEMPNEAISLNFTKIRIEYSQRTRVRARAP
jgi:hypothetical protein